MEWNPTGFNVTERDISEYNVIMNGILNVWLNDIDWKESHLVHIALCDWMEPQ